MYVSNFSSQTLAFFAGASSNTPIAALSISSLRSTSDVLSQSFVFAGSDAGASETAELSENYRISSLSSPRSGPKGYGPLTAENREDIMEQVKQSSAERSTFFRENGFFEADLPIGSANKFDKVSVGYNGIDNLWERKANDTALGFLEGKVSYINRVVLANKAQDGDLDLARVISEFRIYDMSHDFDRDVNEIKSALFDLDLSLAVMKNSFGLSERPIFVNSDGLLDIRDTQITDQQGRVVEEIKVNRDGYDLSFTVTGYDRAGGKRIEANGTLASDDFYQDRVAQFNATYEMSEEEFNKLSMSQERIDVLQSIAKRGGVSSAYLDRQQELLDVQNASSAVAASMDSLQALTIYGESKTLDISDYSESNRPEVAIRIANSLSKIV